MRERDKEILDFKPKEDFTKNLFLLRSPKREAQEEKERKKTEEEDPRLIEKKIIEEELLSKARKVVIGAKALKKILEMKYAEKGKFKIREEELELKKAIFQELEIETEEITWEIYRKALDLRKSLFSEMKNEIAEKML